MDNTSRVIADITDCTLDQAHAVITALVEAGWSPPSTEPHPETDARITIPTQLDELPVGTALTAHTDGACSGNPGPGGWAVVFSVEGAVVDEFFDAAEGDTTNNQMELTAVREAITRAPVGVVVEIQTDSKNVIGWLDGGFKRNVTAIAALCGEIDALRATRSASGGGKVTFKHLLGHQGDTLNERADTLARGAIKGL